MDEITLARDLLIILAAGLFAGLLSKSLRVPTLVGYMLIGVLIGSGGIGLIRETTIEVEHLAELGVFLLLFAIGLEFSLDELLRLGRHLLVGGSVQMLLVALPAGGVLFALGYDWPVALVLASAVAFSSTVLVFRTLAEWGQNGSPTGRRMIGVLLFQDAALVPLLLMIPLIAQDAAPPTFTDYLQLFGKSVGFVAAVVVLRWVLKTWFVPALARRRSIELVVLATLVVLVGVTFATHQIGLPAAVGAFAAGLMLSGNRWTGQIDALVLPLRETFAAVFFVSLGMMLDPAVLVRQPLVAVGLFCALILLKTFAATIALRLTGLRWRTSFGAGMGLAHVGEFAFVLVAMGAESGLLARDAVQLFVAVGVASLLLSPILLKNGLRLTREETAEHALPRAPNDAAEPATRTVVIIGIGPVGARIATLMETLGRDVCLVDRSPLNLQPFAQTGFRTIAGDATEQEILKNAGAVDAADIVICVPDDDIARDILRQARELNEKGRIIVRCRYQTNATKLTHAGADCVISEEKEAAGALERALL